MLHMPFESSTFYSSSQILYKLLQITIPKVDRLKEVSKSIVLWIKMKEPSLLFLFFPLF